MRKTRTFLFTIIAVLFITPVITSIKISNTQTQYQEYNYFSIPFLNEMGNNNLKTSGAAIDHIRVNTYDDDDLDVTVYVDYPLLGAILNYIKIQAGWLVFYFDEFFNFFSEDNKILDNIVYYSKQVDYGDWLFNQIKAYTLHDYTFDENRPSPDTIHPSDYGYPSSTYCFFLNNEDELEELYDLIQSEEIMGKPVIIGYEYVRAHTSSPLSSYGYTDFLRIEDDDTRGPSITCTNYGSQTDGNPGYIYTTASDSSGVYSAPTRYTYLSNELGTYTYTFYATDADNDWGSYKDDKTSSQKSHTVKIVDDDTSGPEIHCKYYGDGTDGNPGYIYTYATDPSGISEAPNSITYVPSELGKHTFTFYARDNDNDRPGKDDTSSSSKTITINIVDDDTEGPTINFEYIGMGTDQDPGSLIVKATDPSKLSKDPSGTYALPHMVGLYIRNFIAVDNDNDRPGDTSLTTKTFSKYLIDDDVVGPSIDITYTGGQTDGDPGYVVVNAYDPSGLSVDPSGIYYLPNTIGWVNMDFLAVDNDNDRPGEDDTSSTIKTFSIYLVDDDTNNPVIHYAYYGDGTDGNPGVLKVIAYDSSGLSQDPSGIYTVAPTLGNQVFYLVAIDNDNDRPFDSLATKEKVVITIIDDDIDAPVLYGLDTSVDISKVNISLGAFDLSGFSYAKVYIDDILIETYDLFQENLNISISISLENNWIMDFGTHNFKIEVFDGDLDRPDDSLFSTVYGTFDITIDNMFAYVINQIEVLKQDFNGFLDDYSNKCKNKCTHHHISKCWSHHLSESINRKLTWAQWHLSRAYELYNEDLINCALIHEFFSKAVIQITEFKTDFLNKIGFINESEYDYLIAKIHNIRNNIIYLMGVTVGGSQAIKIAHISVDLLNLIDDIDDEIGCHCSKNCILSKLYNTEKILECCILKLSFGCNIDRKLDCAQSYLDKAVIKVKCLLKHNMISQELSDRIIERIHKIQLDIGELNTPI
ncbi:MAG: hypothetical protein JXA99_16145 [Candidatus Lokiarchaeota archaeon]|nr:hypothetical protein [Candidatus Lokiarchaeota archaeon]